MHICYNGCSFTWGDGFTDEQKPLYTFDHLVSNKLNAYRENIARKGSSNYTIFMRSLQALEKNSCDILVVQWSAVHRAWLSPGPDAFLFINDHIKRGYTYRDIHISKSNLEHFKKTFQLLNHDYQNLLDLCDYVSALDTIAQSKQIKIVHVNGLLPWRKDLVSFNEDDLASTLDTYTKDILDFDNRDDEEILFYLKKLHSRVTAINSSNWVNQFDSWYENTVDKGPLGHHPGIQSHHWMAQKVIEHLA